MTGEELVAGLRADFDALEQIAGLVQELYWRVKFVEDASGPVELGVRAALAHQRQVDLAELGVDLNLPDLSALLAATVARAPEPASSGTATADPEHTTETPSPSVPLEPELVQDLVPDMEPTHVEAWEATDGRFVAEIHYFDDATEPPGPSPYVGDEDDLVPDPEWKPGDPCAACGSTNTGADELGVAYCRDCNSRDDDE